MLLVVGGATMLAGQMQGRLSRADGGGDGAAGRALRHRVDRALPSRRRQQPVPPDDHAVSGGRHAGPGHPVRSRRRRPERRHPPADGRQPHQRPDRRRGAATAPSRTKTSSIAHDPANRHDHGSTTRATAARPRPATDDVVTNLQFVYRNPARAITTNPNNVAFIETRVTVRTRIERSEPGAPDHLRRQLRSASEDPMTRHPNRPDVASERGMALVSALLLHDASCPALAIALTASGRIEVAMGDNEEVYARRARGGRIRAEPRGGRDHPARPTSLPFNPTPAGRTRRPRSTRPPSRRR